MELKKEVVVTEKYLAELQEDIIWATNSMNKAQSEFEAAKEAHNAAKNLCSVLNANQFASESYLANTLLQKITRAMEYKEVDYMNACDIYRDFQSDLAEVELLNKN